MLLALCLGDLMMTDLFSLQIAFKNKYKPFGKRFILFKIKNFSYKKKLAVEIKAVLKYATFNKGQD